MVACPSLRPRMSSTPSSAERKGMTTVAQASTTGPEPAAEDENATYKSDAFRMQCMKVRDSTSHSMIFLPCHVPVDHPRGPAGSFRRRARWR